MLLLSAVRAYMLCGIEDPKAPPQPPKTSPRGFLTPPRRRQEPPRRLQDAFKSLQDASKSQAQWPSVKAVAVRQGWSGGGSPAWGVFDPPDHLGGKGVFKIVQRTSKMLPRAARMCPGGLSPLGNFLGILLLARSWHSWLVSASKTPPTASKTPSKTEHNGLLLRLWPYTEGGLAVVRPLGASSIE